MHVVSMGDPHASLYFFIYLHTAGRPAPPRPALPAAACVRQVPGQHNVAADRPAVPAERRQPARRHRAREHHRRRGERIRGAQNHATCVGCGSSSSSTASTTTCAHSCRDAPPSTQHHDRHDMCACACGVCFRQPACNSHTLRPCSHNQPQHHAPCHHQVFSVLPFGNTMVILNVTGVQVSHLLHLLLDLP